MRLVNQKEILLLRSFSEKAPEMGIRIKYIIVITDDRISPDRKIQRHLKRTYGMLSCIGFNLIPAHIIGVGQHIKDRIIDPVKVSFRIRAGIRIAFRFFTKADLLFCSQSNNLAGQSLLL